ncbi:hypothetical protein PM8797T_12518 [Gimesia maris DSM 8797]|nr:hypothetical protein PM8797T_12518 [Gimesia maris DSM 8797]
MWIQFLHFNARCKVTLTAPDDWKQSESTVSKEDSLRIFLPRKVRNDTKEFLFREKEWVAPNAIRGCRRQQETVSESIRMIGEFPIQDSAGCGTMCPPA